MWRYQSKWGLCKELYIKRKLKYKKCDVEVMRGWKWKIQYWDEGMSCIPYSMLINVVVNGWVNDENIRLGFLHFGNEKIKGNNY